MQVMKTYHMYNADSISAQSKLKEAEKQEEKQIGKSVKQEDRQTPRSPDSTSNVRIEEKHVRRSSVKKIEKMKEKVRTLGAVGSGSRAPEVRTDRNFPVGARKSRARNLWVPLVPNDQK